MEIQLDAIIAIDVQNYFVRTPTINVLPPLCHFIDSWIKSQKKGKTIITQFVNTSESPFTQILNWDKMLSALDYSAQIAPEFLSVIEPFLHEEGIIFYEKSSYSIMTPEFRKFQSGHNLKRIGLIGFSTHACVLKSALDLFENGIEPFVIADLCGSHNSTAEHDLHKYSIEILERLIGSSHIISTSTHRIIPTNTNPSLSFVENSGHLFDSNTPNLRKEEEQLKEK